MRAPATSANILVAAVARAARARTLPLPVVRASSPQHDHAHRARAPTAPPDRATRSDAAPPPPPPPQLVEFRGRSTGRMAAARARPPARHGRQRRRDGVVRRVRRHAPSTRTGTRSRRRTRGRSSASSPPSWRATATVRQGWRAVLAFGGNKWKKFAGARSASSRRHGFAPNDPLVDRPIDVVIGDGGRGSWCHTLGGAKATEEALEGRRADADAADDVPLGGLDGGDRRGRLGCCAVLLLVALGYVCRCAASSRRPSSARARAVDEASTTRVEAASIDPLMILDLPSPPEAPCARSRPPAPPPSVRDELYI